PHKAAALSSRTIRVRIRDLKTRSCCCTMVVDILSNNNNNNRKPSTAFLKLHDWRYADTLRQHMGIGPWCPSTEFAYIRSLGGHTRTVLSIYDDQDAAQRETSLAGILGDSFAHEAAVYDSLRAHQGATLPRLLAAVDFDLTPPGADNHELFYVRVLLLENLMVDDGGFSLRTLPHHAPRDAWQGLVDAAVEAGRLLGEHGVLDPDRHAGNFLVVPRTDGGFRVVMIDFGHCRSRREGESERVVAGGSGAA
ncbi:hypothetical protein C8A01DRAFT_19870, partial [Parachaetomium inaequale]